MAADGIRRRRHRRRRGIQHDRIAGSNRSSPPARRRARFRRGEATSRAPAAPWTSSGSIAVFRSPRSPCRAIGSCANACRCRSSRSLQGRRRCSKPPSLRDQAQARRSARAAAHSRHMQGQSRQRARAGVAVGGAVAKAGRRYGVARADRRIIAQSEAPASGRTIVMLQSELVEWARRLREARPRSYSAETLFNRTGAID